MSVFMGRRRAAIVATTGFGALFVFQVLLAVGAPLGRAAYGGVSDTLPPALRITSVVSALIVLGALWAVLSSSGILAVGKRLQAIARRMLRGYVALFSLSAVANVASTSPWERFGMAPFAVVMVVCCVRVGFDPRPGDNAEGAD